ncbi:MAG: 3-deoxy-D-manno-octulosonic acid transferase [Desulfobulbus oligotrophicus]|nr:3-deoxy-D-manno-octulosonic acid transferase [Desulfobulbus oligotrophicus]
MCLLYQISTGLLTVLALPLLLCLAIRRKYRGRLVRRLGWELKQQLAQLSSSSARNFWIHALSVGEVTSALPLVRGLRDSYPDANIIFSVTTRSGMDIARKLFDPDSGVLIIDAPVDVGPVVPFFTGLIKPDLFILVETDFWPHWLHFLARQGIPTILVNGRISSASFQRYQRFSALFRPMFATFTLLSMQTEADAAAVISLGLDAGRVKSLGNLKFDTSHLQAGQSAQENISDNKQQYGFAPAAPLWICGSTHRGEEVVIFEVLVKLRTSLPDLQLLLAPRNIERRQEIVALANQFGLSTRCWSEDRTSRGPLLILDTIGELVACYPMADVVFVGGSLVAEGGHNPIEPASAGVPVLFGPHMEDFSEVAAGLVEAGGAQQVVAADELYTALQHILTSAAVHQSMAQSAWRYVELNRGVVDRHLQSIQTVLDTGAVNR